MEFMRRLYVPMLKRSPFLSRTLHTAATRHQQAAQATRQAAQSVKEAAQSVQQQVEKRVSMWRDKGINVGPPEAHRYSKPLSWMHWLMAGGMLGSVYSVHMAYRTQGETKEYWLKWHNTSGLIMGVALLPRVWFRISTRIPAHFAGNWVEHLLATGGHLLLYGTMFFLPLSGIYMVWLGGAGAALLPTGRLPGKGLRNVTTEDGDMCKHLFKLHKEVGEFFTYVLVPLHVGAAAWHQLRGHNIFTRINPLSSRPAVA